MRTVVKVLLLLGALALNIAAWANGTGEGDAVPMQAQIVEHRNEIVAVHYAMETVGKVKIKITVSETGQVVYATTDNSHQSVVKKFDLSHLASGKYLIEVTDGTSTTSKVVEVE